MADRLAVSTNSYHSYTFEEALAGIAGAGYTSVELSSVPGWTEHVLRDSTDADLDRVRNSRRWSSTEPEEESSWPPVLVVT